MMLEFAMRNGDVLRLRDENFVEKDSQHYLNYTPYKTELSSGRRVFCAKGIGIGMPAGVAQGEMNYEKIVGPPGHFPLFQRFLKERTSKFDKHV